MHNIGGHHRAELEMTCAGANEAANCGACGAACGAGQKCFAAACSMMACDNKGTWVTATLNASGPREVFGEIIMDIDKDGKQDLLFSNQLDTVVTLYWGHGDGTFDAPVNFASDFCRAPARRGDLNAGLRA